ncbi:MAG: DUF4974 domain-containing protein [Cryomorphaceae bacterium]|nr:DUF4974 domain-containing protein [Cryomorphaceae bacterium]
MDSLKNTIDFDLLAKYLAGECTDAERDQVQLWLAESDENQTSFNDFKAVWDLAERPANQSIDIEKAWGTVDSRLRTGSTISIWTKISKIAAIALLVLGVGAALRYFLKSDADILTYQGATDKNVVLTDGSKVGLQDHAHLTFAEMGDSLRIVTLSGEAFFEVTPNKVKPFVVHAPLVDVRVLGTKFNVKSEEDGVTVYLEEGSVLLNSSKMSMTIEPGQTARCDVQGNITLMEKAGDNAAYWHTHVLKYRSIPLSQVVEELNVIYDQRIIISDEATANCLFSSTFNDESIDLIVEVIAATFNLTVTKQDDKTILHGTGCQTVD